MPFPSHISIFLDLDPHTLWRAEITRHQTTSICEGTYVTPTIPIPSTSLTDHNLLDNHTRLDHPYLQAHRQRTIPHTQILFRPTFNSCAPGGAVKLVSTATMFVAANPSIPFHAAGIVPGAAYGIKYSVCATSSSTWIANASGRSSPFAFRDGATYVVIVILPACPIVLKL